MPPKTPDNKPFDFNLDAYIKGLDLQPFRFHFSDRRWEMKHFDDLDSREAVKALQKVQQSGNDDAILVLTMGGEQLADFNQVPMPLGGKRELVKRYFEHCGLDLGELLGSTSS